MSLAVVRETVNFAIDSEDRLTAARSGVMQTAHGVFQTPAFAPVATAGSEPAEERQPTLACPQCQAAMECISDIGHPGWNRVFNGRDCPWWYDPFRHARASATRHIHREPRDG